MDMLELADQLADRIPEARSSIDRTQDDPAPDDLLQDDRTRDDPAPDRRIWSDRTQAGALDEDRTEAGRTPDAPPATSLYGSFFLAGVEFALPVAVIQEVVVFPARVTAIPLAPPFLVGVFNLRGTIVPVIDLATLLGLAVGTVTASRKIAIVDFDGTRVGLVFDETGEMLRVQASDKHAFRYTDDAPHHVVKGALKLAGGERIVQVLDPRALLMIEQVPQILDKQRAGGLQRRGAVQQRRQCVSFRLGRTALAFEIGAIHEIVRVPQIQESVLRSDYCAGMFTLRGDVMPLVDFGALLGMKPASADLGATGMADERRVMIMLVGDQHVGLLVDSVESIVGFAADELLPIPSVGARRAAMFAGWISRADSDDIVLLKHDALLTHTELTELTQGHSRLYAHGKGEGTDARRRRERGERQVFITFRLDNLMALPIGDLREIIRPDGEMLTPPGLPPAICGMLNLRRRLVSIVDLRTLYQLAPRGDSAAEVAQTKILIVERGADAYGLIVDSVENIVHVYAGDKLPVPSILIDASQKTLRGDLKEIVEVPQSVAAKDGPTVAMMIFDIAQLTGRIAQLLDD